MKRVYYRLKDGVPIPFTGSYVRLGSYIVAPPTPSALASLGYLPMAEVTPPEFDASTSLLSVSYTERDGVIYPQYTVTKGGDDA